MGLGTKFQASAGKRKRTDDEQDDEEDSKLVGRRSINIDTDEEGSNSDDSDDSDEDDDEEDDEGLTGECEYEEETESFPKCVAYDKDFPQIGKDLISIPKRTVAIIDRSGCKSKRVQGCRHNADELTSLPRAKREKICLLGNTGAGKSSLLNALLGLPNLAKAMAGGQSCTFVGTQYESPFDGQTKELAAKVEYFGIDEIEDLLSRLLKDYNTWKFEQQEDWDDDEKQELKRLCTTAFNTFRSLFCDKNESESPRAAEEFLDVCYKNEDGDQDALAKMVEFCKELLEDKEADEADRTEYLDADTQQELLEQLDPLVTSNSRYEDPTLWPLVKKVRIGIEGPRILHYIIIVDLPGLDDTNQVRVNASLEMMRSCQSIWVVTKIDRAITESTVDSLLMRFGKTYKMTVICTGIDANFDDDLPAHLESEGQSIGNHDELFEEEKRLRKASKSIPKKIETRRARLEGRNKSKAKKPRQLSDKTREKLDTQLAELENELKEVETQLPKICQERFDLLVDARNSNTIRRLREEKSEHLPVGVELKVFCVSNLHYIALKGARVINGPRLDAEMTGIPALRTYILESAAPHVLKCAEDFINYKFTVFMKGLAMWAKSFSVEGSSELLASIEKSHCKIGGVLDKYHDGMVEANESTMVKALEDSHESQLHAATAALEKKRSWHWSTTRAFVRKNGKHKTTVAPKQCWNEQFMEGTIEVVNEHWPSLQEKREEIGDELKTGLMGLVQEVSTMVNNHPAHMVLPMDRVNEIFEAQLEGVKQAYATHQEDLNLELRNINNDLKMDHDSGYFHQAMAEAYEKCQRDSGSGIKLRTFNTFEAHLQLEGTRSPFAVVAKKLNDAISKDVKSKNRPLVKKIDRIFKSIHDQFDDIVDQKMDDASEAEVRDQIRSYLEVAEVKFEDIKADLARIKRRYEQPY